MLPTVYSPYYHAHSVPIVTPVLTVHDNYAANDYIGTSGVPMEFTGCGLSGWLLAAQIIDYAIQSVNGKLFIFNASVTPPADSAEWALSDADMLKCIGVIAFTSYYTAKNNSTAFGIPATIGNVAYTSASGSLFGCFKTDGAPTLASGDLSFRLSILRAGDR